MQSFLAAFAPHVLSVLSGFDRLVFRGRLIPLHRPKGMHCLLDRVGVRFLDFKKYVQRTSDRVKETSLQEAVEQDRPVRYLTSSRLSKEDLARTLLEENPIDSGLICAFKVVEPCMSFEYHCSQNKAERGLKLRKRKCLHIYKYYLHPVFGFMHVRIQTWFPFTIQVCMNGREWLSRQFAAEGFDDYRRRDNCFTYLGDPELAQALMDQQLQMNWKCSLDELAQWANPVHDEIFASWPQSYYWVTYQSEWATDLAFASPIELGKIYPRFVERATLDFRSPDVMRFLGRKCHGRYEGELTTSFKDRAEGVRVKHWADSNSIKMYDKMGSVLRIETTIANPTPYKVFRTKDNDPKGKKAYLPMRKGIADLHRRTQVSQQANERYLESLATGRDGTRVADLFDTVSKPRRIGSRRVRALRLNDPAEVALLKTLTSGEFELAGFRNKDLRQCLYSPKGSEQELKRQSARISRLLRLLRDHGLIRKVQKSYRYRLTEKGRTLITALQSVRRSSLERLEACAA